MLIKLSGRGLRALSTSSSQPFIARIRGDSGAAGDREVFLATNDGALPAGFRAYLLREPRSADLPNDTYVLSDEFAYLADGDVVRIDPRNREIHALYRRRSPFNALLVTERCDNLCVMCSQPPKDRDDSWIADELLEAIPLMASDTAEIGITGGEPSLLGDRLLAIVASLKQHLPQTAVHILSNGRSFAKTDLARELAALRHPDLMLGIPLYSDIPERHDFVVQARGAYDETVRGILKLKEHGVQVELRFVIHRETYADLPAFARFVARNLLFVDHVALMGLEPTGFAKANLEALWVDPLDYQDELREAVEVLEWAGVRRVSIYNHQLCVLDRRLHHLARASISDWKNLYLDACHTCSLRGACGGFFASSTVRQSRGIAPVVEGITSG